MSESKLHMPKIGSKAGRFAHTRCPMNCLRGDHAPAVTPPLLPQAPCPSANGDTPEHSLLTRPHSLLPGARSRLLLAHPCPYRACRARIAMAAPKLNSTSIMSLCSSPPTPPPSMPLAPQPPPQTLGEAKSHHALPSTITIVLDAWPPAAVVLPLPATAGRARAWHGHSWSWPSQAGSSPPLPALAG